MWLVLHCSVRPWQLWRMIMDGVITKVLSIIVNSAHHQVAQLHLNGTIITDHSGIIVHHRTGIHLLDMIMDIVMIKDAISQVVIVINQMLIMATDITNVWFIVLVSVYQIITEAHIIT